MNANAAQRPIGLLSAASGRTTRDESIATPTKRRSTPAAIESSRSTVPSVVGEHRPPEDDERRHDDERSDPRHERGEPRLRKRRTLADGCDRRHARRTDRREEAREERDADTDDQGDDDCPGGEDSIGAREVHAETPEERFDPLGEDDAQPEADERRGKPDHERFEDHGSENLASRRSDRPQRRELACALRDGDRERVEDDERAHEERDEAEREEEVPEDRCELAHLVRLLLGLGRRADDLGAGGENGGDRGDDVVFGDTLAGGHRDRVVLTFSPEELLGGRDREHDEADATEAVDLPVLGDADELERAFRLQRGDLNGVPDLESLLVGCPGVDDDLVVARRASDPRRG